MYLEIRSMELSSTGTSETVEFIRLNESLFENGKILWKSSKISKLFNMKSSSRKIQARYFFFNKTLKIIPGF